MADAPTPLRTLLVDDEPLARQRLTRQLAPFVETGRLVLEGEAEDGVDALDAVAEAQDAGTPVDVLFLDIQMPGLDGFAVVERLAPPRPQVVFVTAHDDRAVEAFQASAVDYLLKPVEADRLAETVARVEARAADRSSDDARTAYLDRVADLLETLEERAHPTASPPAGDDADYLRQLSLPGRDRFTIVPVHRLVAAEVQDGLTSLYILDEGEAPSVTRHVVTHPLDALEARLDPTHYMRIHRSALVNLDHIREMVSWFSGRYKLLLSGGHEVLASRSRSRALRDRLSL
ncbi:MAG: LytTR family DNA-binding domain-containing protein [Bacteroidota bacterium]